MIEFSQYGDPFGEFDHLQIGTAQPTVGSDWVMPSVTAAAIGGTSLSGGRGSILGALIGGCFMGVVQNAITILLSQHTGSRLLQVQSFLLQLLSIV